MYLTQNFDCYMMEISNQYMFYKLGEYVCIQKYVNYYIYHLIKIYLKTLFKVN